MTIVSKLVSGILVSSLIMGLFSVPVSAVTRQPAAKAKVVPKKKIQYVPRRLDGVAVPKGAENKWPVAVMIDNHPAARPQSGLQAASIVYESLAEGGIPRFMAVFADDTIARIGPVRSTRPYFVRYASEYSAAMAHAGGSPDGLKMVTQLKLLSIEGIKGKYAKFFFRAFGGGVHGLYTSGKKLAEALKLGRLINKKPTYRPYQFKADSSAANRGKNGSGVSIDLGYGKLFDIKYTYDKSKNAYKRFTGGYAHRDRLTNAQVTVKNVIVLVVPKEKVLDKKGRLDLHTIGTDKGVLFQNGKSIPIRWVKKSNRARTLFYDMKGKEISLVQGNTWITVVPRGHSYKIF